MPATQTAEPNRADYTTSAAKAMLDEARICRDVMEGTTHLRQKAGTYLPGHPGEEIEDYARRLKLAVLFNAMDRTVTGLAGMVFRRDPEPGKDVPAIIVEHLENIDYAGTHLDAFGRSVFEDGLEAGHAGILVDAPAVQAPDGRRLTQAEERALDLRPYWVHVRKEQIISWRTAQENGRTVLTQLVIHEPTTVDDGAFGETDIDRYRVYRRIRTADVSQVTVEVWEKRADQSAPEIAEPEAVVTNQEDIPFAVYYARKTGLLQSRPPLVDLAHTNIAHYQTLADHRYCLHIANVPTPWISGIPRDAEIVFGPNSGIRIPDPQGKAGYLEPDGAAFATNMKQLQEFKADMAAMGLNMLQRERRAAETARANEMDQNIEQSALAVAARSFQDCLEAALNFHARFMRLPSGGSIQVNRDYQGAELTHQEIDQYSQLVLRGQWSLRTLWAKLSEGGVNPEDFDPDVEETRIQSFPDPNVIDLPSAA